MMQKSELEESMFGKSRGEAVIQEIQFLGSLCREPIMQSCIFLAVSS
ncbi:MAG: hypothetical protein ACRC3H_00705 [Lachnospiraceae bacterium]